MCDPNLNGFMSYCILDLEADKNVLYKVKPVFVLS